MYGDVGEIHRPEANIECEWPGQKSLHALSPKSFARNTPKVLHIRLGSSLPLPCVHRGVPCVWVCVHRVSRCQDRHCAPARRSLPTIVYCRYCCSAAIVFSSSKQDAENLINLWYCLLRRLESVNHDDVNSRPGEGQQLGSNHPLPFNRPTLQTNYSLSLFFLSLTHNHTISVSGDQATRRVFSPPLNTFLRLNTAVASFRRQASVYNMPAEKKERDGEGQRDPKLPSRPSTAPPGGQLIAPPQRPSARLPRRPQKAQSPRAGSHSDSPHSSDARLQNRARRRNNKCGVGRWNLYRPVANLRNSPAPKMLNPHALTFSLQPGQRLHPGFAIGGETEHVGRDQTRHWITGYEC